MEEIVENALGHMVVEIDGDPDDTLYGYFEEYGTVPLSTDELVLITDQRPEYPVASVVEVRVERLNAAYQVTEARTLNGEWHSMDEVEDEL